MQIPFVFLYSQLGTQHGKSTLTLIYAGWARVYVIEIFTSDGVNGGQTYEARLLYIARAVSTCNIGV